MAQMYKIFVGKSLVVFHEKDKILPPVSVGEILMNFEKDSDVEHIYELSEETTVTKIHLICEDVKRAFNVFAKAHKIVEAAGGLVSKDKQKYLFIYRNGFWDLPKGKIEKNEAIPTAALREVEEECGIDSLELEEQLVITHHTYELKGKRVLKPTYWFRMKSDFDGKLIPQTEEGITEVKWFSSEETKKLAGKMYGSIQLICEEHIWN